MQLDILSTTRKLVETSSYILYSLTTHSNEESMVFFFSFHVEALLVSFGALAQRLDDEKWRHCFHVEIQYFQTMNDEIAERNTFRQTLSLMPFSHSLIVSA